MAKFKRFDPRNKKKDRNKSRSINKDLRIREQEEHKVRGKKIEWIVANDVEHYYYEEKE